MQTFVGSRDCTKIFKPQLGHFSEKRFETIENLQYVMIRHIMLDQFFCNINVMKEI